MNDIELNEMLLRDAMDTIDLEEQTTNIHKRLSVDEAEMLGLII